MKDADLFKMMTNPWSMWNNTPGDNGDNKTDPDNKK
jgi:hypothetical protein